MNKHKILEGLTKVSKNDTVFKIIIALAVLVFIAGLSSLINAFQGFREISDANRRVEREQSALERQEEQVSSLEEKYIEIEESSPINIVDNGHITLQEIRSMGANMGVGVSFSSEGGVARENVRFSREELSMNPNSGLLEFNGNMIFRYTKYADLKRFLSAVESRFPVAIKNIIMGQSGNQAGFTLFGVGKD